MKLRYNPCTTLSIRDNEEEMVLTLPQTKEEKKRYVTIAEKYSKAIWHYLKTNMKCRKGATLGMCALFLTNPCFASTVGGTSAVAPLVDIVKQLVDGVQIIGFYLGMAMSLFEVIKSFMEGDPRRIPGVVTKYAIGVALLYAVPGILGTIKDSFKKASVVAN